MQCEGYAMSKKEVIILHEYGAIHHYRSLKYLIDNDESSEIKFYEFSIARKIFKSILKMDWKLFVRQIYNISNMFNLFFSKNKKVVLGAAAYDYRMYFLSIILRKHRVYYHTSRPFWHDDAPIRHKLFYSASLLRCWNRFLTDTSEVIFSVTMCTKKSLVSHKNVDPEKISVVYHSFDSTIYYPNAESDFDGVVKFLYVGRLTESKGVDKIIEFFRKYVSGVSLTVVGDGHLQSEVENLAKECRHVTYRGYVENPDSLADIYREMHFLLLPSVRQEVWQELFGMVIIEAMACGVVPIASSHVGPKEIITDNRNGHLMQEHEFEEKIKDIVSQFELPAYLGLRDGAIEKAGEFTVENISVKWRSLLEN